MGYYMHYTPGREFYHRVESCPEDSVFQFLGLSTTQILVKQGRRTNRSLPDRWSREVFEL